MFQYPLVLIAGRRAVRARWRYFPPSKKCGLVMDSASQSDFLSGSARYDCELLRRHWSAAYWSCSLRS
jgi:hypothetical protein